MHRLAPAFAWDADHRALRDRGKLRHHVLDLGRIHVLAAGHDHVLDAVDDVDEPVLHPCSRRRRCASSHRPPPCAVSSGRSQYPIITTSPLTQISPTVPGGTGMSSRIDDADLHAEGGAPAGAMAAQLAAFADLLAMCSMVATGDSRSCRRPAELRVRQRGHRRDRAAPRSSARRRTRCAQRRQVVAPIAGWSTSIWIIVGTSRICSPGSARQPASCLGAEGADHHIVPPLSISEYIAAPFARWNIGAACR